MAFNLSFGLYGDFLYCLKGGEEGRPPAVVSVDSSRRRMSGPILNTVSLSQNIESSTTVIKDLVLIF